MNSSLTEFAKQSKKSDRKSWFAQLPIEIQEEIVDNRQLGPALITRWLLTEGYEGATERKVSYALQQIDYESFRI
jgi:hypothetical protein